MGRTSKRISAAGTGQIIHAWQQEKIYYRAGVYARLSVDQDLKKNESVENQIMIAENYVADWNRRYQDRIEIVGRYTDLGKTGTNFERDAFKRLMQDVRLGDINCVIVKDLSRFGRNYLEAGNYIEKIFPFLGVRFIAVADGYDSGVAGDNTRQMASEIKNLINDMYARDFSKKTKLSLKQRREAGAYVGGPPPYGYEVYKEGQSRKLRPDGNTAEIVRVIYRKFVETGSYQAVVDYLNVRRINPPAIYKKRKEIYCPLETAYEGWGIGAVERIVKSETYTGNLVQGRTSITGRKEENRIHKPEEEWVRKENTHEALIDQWLYEQAREIRRRIQERTQTFNHPTKGCPIRENIFNNVLYCGVCGKKMIRSSYVQDYVDGRRERKDGYFCPDSKRTRTQYCPDSNRISQNELLDRLFSLFRTEFSVRMKKRKDYVEQGHAFIQKKELELDRLQRQTQKQILVLAETEGEKYAAYRMGELNQEEYVRCRLQWEEQLQELEKQKKRYEEERKRLGRKGETYLQAVRALIRLKNEKELDKELVEALIEKIYVYPGKRVEVVLSYSDILAERVK
jgi:hypothetical protein